MKFLMQPGCHKGLVMPIFQSRLWLVSVKSHVPKLEIGKVAQCSGKLQAHCLGQESFVMTYWDDVEMVFIWKQHSLVLVVILGGGKEERGGEIGLWEDAVD